MSLAGFLDFRFGDPITSLSLNNDALVYGTIMGRILFYNIRTGLEKALAEACEAGVFGIWVDGDYSVYSAVGAVRVNIVTGSEYANHVTSNVHLERPHE